MSILGRLAALAMLALPAAVAWPQGFPNKPIRFIAPFPPGGSSDLIARILSQRMSEELGQPVVVDNRPGAGGNVGTEMSARAPADGYTLLLGSVAALAINPHLVGKVGYDPVKDFAAVAAIARAPQMLVVHPSLPATTVREFIALARSKPNALVCGSGGVGTPAHFGCELLRLRGNAQLLHVPYKGTGQSINDLLGAQIHAVFASMPVAYPHVRAGKLRGLASTSPERSTLAPELPTMLEAGVPGFVSESWWGVFAPAGTPGEMVARFGAELTASLREPRIATQLTEGQQVTMALSGPQELRSFLVGQMKTWGAVAREFDIKGE
jgi:tripartite-type tricarboxylate transporter receptor subunit TctC